MLSHGPLLNKPLLDTALFLKYESSTIIHGCVSLSLAPDSIENFGAPENEEDAVLKSLSSNLEFSINTFPQCALIKG